MVSSGNRDEFSEKTKHRIAKRAGWLCSDPDCRRLTVGASGDGEGEINIGVVAHICAAAPGGPRYDSGMTREQRTSADNGILLCAVHAQAIDSDETYYTVERLRGWQSQAHRDSNQRVLRGTSISDRNHHPNTSEHSGTMVRVAAVDDLTALRNSPRWPTTSVALMANLAGRVDPVSPVGMAKLLTEVDDLVLVAGPGMGKTTAVFQVAEALVLAGRSPVVIPLGDWATGDKTIFASVLQRQAFRNVSEDDLRAAAAQGEVVMLLDGWNEIDAAACRRAKVELTRWQWELPKLAVLVTTRREASDVPVDGARVELKPLSGSQQTAIALALKGEAGERALQLGWQTSELRELIRIPLYLNTLIALPEGSALPTTKEETLRSLVASTRQDYVRADSVDEATEGLHERYLEGLAVAAVRTGSTSLPDRVAYKAISDVAKGLLEDGQIGHAPSPRQLLRALTGHHLLVRVDRPAGYSFQHQQFQEWFASSSVVRLIVAAATDAGACARLKSNVFNVRGWEESILFACERLGRRKEAHQRACGAAVLSAFDVDPMLAAEMIHRSSEAVWRHVCDDIMERVGRWHTPGKVDRAVGFMVKSGRVEFLEAVWPLLTHENQQMQLSALRIGGRIRCSMFGDDSVPRLQELPAGVRKTLLVELAYESEADGLRLVSEVARIEPVSEIRAEVVEGLVFSGALNQAIEVLDDADDKTFDVLARRDALDEIENERIAARLKSARQRRDAGEKWPSRRVASLIYHDDDEKAPHELEAAIAELKIVDHHDWGTRLTFEASRRFPQTVARGTLRRLREGRELPHRAEDLLAAVEFALEDDELLQVALDGDEFSARSNAAAAVLGPGAVGCLIDEYFVLDRTSRESSEPRAKEGSAKCRSAIRQRLRATRIANLVRAAASRGEQADIAYLAKLADLIAGHSDGQPGNYDQPFNSAAIGAVTELVLEWGERVLGSATVKRSEMATIARLASRAPSPRLLELLKRMLDWELATWRNFRARAEATGFAQSAEASEARTVWIEHYARAFLSIRCEEATQLMVDYLPDEDFGPRAARVLAEQWQQAHEPTLGGWGKSGNYSRVANKRADRSTDPRATCHEADSIFGVVEPLLGRTATAAQKKHAVALATAAASLPHGQRANTIATLVEESGDQQLNALLNNLVLSGEVIHANWVQRGISSLLDKAQQDLYALREPWQLGAWLRLLPFTDRPSAAVEAVKALPEMYRRPKWLEEMVSVFPAAPGKDAEDAFFTLAKFDDRLYQDRRWIESAFEFGTLSSGSALIELVDEGKLHEGSNGMPEWSLVERLSALMGTHEELRGQVYERLETGGATAGCLRLARAVAANPDVDGLWVLMDLEKETSQRFITDQTIARLVSKQIADQQWDGAYSIVQVPVVELRQKLLALVSDGGSNDAAARCLMQIDLIRDESGAPMAEPRHPDLDSGKPWPLIAAD